MSRLWWRCASGILPALIAVSLSFGLCNPLSAAAEELRTVRVAKAVTGSFPFSGMEIGQETGIWKSVGLQVEIIAMQGDAKIQQAFAAGAIDFGVGSGPSMGFAVKGVPAHAVAALAGKPQNMVLVASTSTDIKTLADAKGKKVGVTTLGSLTDWLARKASEKEGWGPRGMEILALGELSMRLSSMKSGEVPINVTTIEQAMDMQDQGLTRTLTTFAEVVPDFHTHVIFARDELIKNDPALVRTFLKGWFRIAAFMRDNRAETVRIVARTMGATERAVDESYPYELGMLSFDGAFNPKALEVIRASLKDLGILNTVPEASALYAPGFVPVSIN